MHAYYYKRRKLARSAPEKRHEWDRESKVVTVAYKIIVYRIMISTFYTRFV